MLETKQRLERCTSVKYMTLRFRHIKHTSSFQIQRQAHFPPLSTLLFELHIFDTEYAPVISPVKSSPNIEHQLFGRQKGSDSVDKLAVEARGIPRILLHNLSHNLRFVPFFSTNSIKHVSNQRLIPSHTLISSHRYMSAVLRSTEGLQKNFLNKSSNNTSY